MELKFFKEDHPDILKTKKNIGRAWFSLFQNQKSFEILSEVHEELLKVFSPNHFEIASTISSLAAL